MIFTNDFFSPSSSDPHSLSIQLIDSYTYEIHYYEQITNLPPSFLSPDNVIFRSKIYHGVEFYYVNKTIYESSLGINAKMFGIIADNATNDGDNLQNAINTSLKLGRRLLLPAGKIWLGEKSLTINLDYTPNYSSYSIRGSGDGITRLICQNDDPNQSSGVFNIFSNNPNINFEIRGLSIKRNGTDKPPFIPPLRFGLGIVVTNARIEMHDISIVDFNYGLILRDVVCGHFNKLNIVGSNIALLAHREDPGDGGTNPNAYNFVNCRFAENQQFCCQMRKIHNVKFDSCVFERNSIVIDITFNGDDGRNSLNVINCYFEGNTRDAYLNLQSSGAHNFIGNIFNRLLPTNNYSIVFENVTSGNIQVINLLGNGFKNGVKYNPPQNIQPIYFIGSPSDYNIIDTNIYEDSGDYPDYTNINVIKLL
ncbi:MAG: hypothetical protein BGO86_12850 [Chryseobacterium sp. 36-9]|nr:MAG: hypothetical protein BGO86_12850 [Chryseobacterium sp. 36-9]